MKRKDKTLLIILSFLFILLTVSGLFLLLSNNPKRLEKVFTFDKYNSILELSELEYSKDSAVSKNVAFIDEFVAQEDGNTCFELLVYSPKTKELVRESICEDISTIDWENPYDDYIGLIPIEVTLEFSRTSFFSYQLQNIKFTLLSDELVSDLIDMSESVEEIKGQIYFKHFQDIAQNGYYTSSTIPIGKGFLNTITFSSISITKISLSGNSLRVYMNTKVHDQNIDLLVNTKGFGYGEAESSDDPIQITKQNFSSIDLNSSYIATFAYLDASKLPKEEEITAFCDVENGGFLIESLCENINIADYQSLGIQNLSKYLEEEITSEKTVEFEKLILNSITKI